MTIRRRIGRDDGAALVMVAAATLVIMGMAALVIDLGNGWRTRRALIPATDAAALAAAQAYVDGETGCSIAPDYLTYNEVAATLISCDKHDIDADRGRVTVTASHPVETWFASAIGFGDYNVQSVSTAAWAPPSAVYGLRPIGLCLEGSSQLQNLIANPPATETDITILYNKDQPDACGNEAEGNWGVIDFDGGSNSLDDIKEWVELGYDGPVRFENHVVSDCLDEHCYEGTPGYPSGAGKELQDLEDSDQYFMLPVFNYVNDLAGANAEFHIAAIIRVRLMRHKITGKESTRFFDLRVKPGLVSGECCSGSGSGSGGNKVIAICGVDPGDFEACEP